MNIMDGLWWVFNLKRDAEIRGSMGIFFEINKAKNVIQAAQKRRTYREECKAYLLCSRCVCSLENVL